jgi:hypothetical protein
MRLRLRRWHAVAVVSAGILAVPTPASAQIENITCTGSSSQTFTPGLTNTSQEVVLGATDVYGPCVSLSHPDITSGIAVYSDIFRLSCTTLLVAGEAPYTIAWNDDGNSSSTMLVTFTLTNVSGQTAIKLQGTVTSGVFAGGTVTALLPYVQPNAAACASEEGLTSQTGLLTLNILHI